DGLRQEGGVVGPAGRRPRPRIDHVGGQGDTRPQGEGAGATAGDSQRCRTDVLCPALFRHAGGRSDGDGGALVVADGGGVSGVAGAGRNGGRLAQVLQRQIDRLVALEQRVVDRRQGDVPGGAGGGAAAEGDGLGAEGAVVRAAGRRARQGVDHVSRQRDARPQGERAGAAAGDGQRRADVLGASLLHHGGGGGDGDGGALVVAD